MRKLGYMLFHPDSTDIIKESDYLTSNGCSIVFMDPYSNVKKNPFNEYTQFELMLTLSKPNDIVLIRDLSYIASSFKHLIQILERFIEHSIHLICIEENINTKELNIHEVFFTTKIFKKLYSQELASKSNETRINSDTKRTGKTKGLKEKTLKKARKVWELKKEGRLKNQEIMDLLGINQGSYYQYCKLGKDGFLD
ncbi:MAG: recombinase family protein [Cyclobacteriaceae bacterium]